MKKRSILFLLVVWIMMSCSRTYRLSPKEYEWIPYKGNEVLVFKSNAGDLDTVFLLTKDTALVFAEPQSVNGDKHEAVSIFCKHSDVMMPNNKRRYLTSNYFRLEKVEDRDAEMYIDFSTKDANFYRLSQIKIDSLSKVKPLSLQTPYGHYNDIYIINGEDYLGTFRKRSDYIAKLYWSKSSGLIRYDKMDSVYWVLMK